MEEITNFQLGNNRNCAHVSTLHVELLVHPLSNYCTETIHPLLTMAGYSFIQLNGQGVVEIMKLAGFENGDKRIQT